MSRDEKASVSAVMGKARFGRLLVETRLRLHYNGGWIWRCKCDCGEVCEVEARNLVRAKAPTRSCGCLRTERLVESNQARRGQKKSGLRKKHDALVLPDTHAHLALRIKKRDEA